MKKNLAVFQGLPIPVDYAPTQTYAVLAKRDGGKTYLTARFEEQLCDAGVFFVTLDPVGKHWSLRAGADGSEQGGKDVWVLGGAHGDVPLQATSGALIADTVIEHPGRYVLDVSGFESDAEQDKFAKDFAVRLFRRKARDPGFPLLLILEEAESFIPERPQPGQQPMLGAFGRIMRQGRNHGIGMWMVAQRAQALNKGVLSQAEVLIVKQLIHKRDRDAVDDWVRSNGTQEQRDTIMASLASLEQNEAWVWSPLWLKAFKRTTVQPRKTFDASASVKAHDAQRSIELVPLDVDALGAQMEQVAERAKAEDPKELQRQLRERDKELARWKGIGLNGREQWADPADLEAELNARGEVSVEEVKVPVFPTELADAIDNDVVGEVRDAGERLIQVADKLRTDMADTRERFSEVSEDARQVRGVGDGKPGSTRPQRAPVAAPQASPGGVASATENPAASNGDSALGPQPLKMLRTLVERHPMTLSNSQWSTLAGYSIRSSSWSASKRALRDAGLVIEQDGQFAPSEDGFTAAGISPGVATSPEEVREQWRNALTPQARAFFDALVAAHPHGLTRDELAEDTGYSKRSSSFSGTLRTLRRNTLVEDKGGTLYASEALFL